MKPRCRRPLWSVAVALGAFGGCQDSAEAPRAASISIYPPSATLIYVREQVEFVATATDQYGATYEGGQIVWSSDSPRVFAVSPQGVVSAVSNGSGTLTAALDGVEATASVDVRQKPDEMKVESGDQQRARAGSPLPDTLVVRVVDEGGTPVPGTIVGFEPSDGEVSSDSVSTGSDGRAGTRWTLGESFGVQSLRASLMVPPLNAVFTAFAQTPEEVADTIRPDRGRRPERASGQHPPRPRHRPRPRQQRSARGRRDRVVHPS